MKWYVRIPVGLRPREPRPVEKAVIGARTRPVGSYGASRSLPRREIHAAATVAAVPFPETASATHSSGVTGTSA